MNRHQVLLLAVVAPLFAFAQDGAKPDAAKPAAEAKAEASEAAAAVSKDQPAAEQTAAEKAAANKPSEAKPAPDTTKKPAGDGNGTPQRFVPSEQVRSDFDVSFPVDI